MRFTEHISWILATAATLFFVSAILPRGWPEPVRAFVRVIIAISFFLIIGSYYLTTGEKFDETAYRLILCRIYNFERCSTAQIGLASEEGRRLQIEEQRRQPTETPEIDADAARRRQQEAERRRKEEIERLQREALEREAEAERQHQAEIARQRQAAEARQREAEAQRRRLAEAERQRLIEEREKETEAERRRQAEVERQRQAEEARQRELDIERRRQAEIERQRQAAEARQREAEAERRRLELERLSRRHAATAVGRDESTGRYYAVTATNRPSMPDAESAALARCNEMSFNCKVLARFVGPGKCVYVASGRTITRYQGGTHRRGGIKTAGSETEALQKCRADFAECNVFHTQCNNSI